MKHIILLGIALYLILSSTVFSSEPIGILSVNVRYSTAKDNENSWANRRDFLAETIRAGKYDFIGGQEVVVHSDDAFNQIKFLTEKLPEYGVLFRSRDLDEGTGEGTPLFYRKDRWCIDEQEQGVFWLSDTPNQPGSNTWPGQSACPRNTTWALFHELDANGKNTGKSVYVFCTHFDHVGPIARQKSAVLIANHISERKRKDVPVVFMGDLNAGEDTAVIRFLKGETIDIDGGHQTAPQPMTDTFRVVHSDVKDAATTNQFQQTPNNSRSKIDYIFVTKGLKATDAEILRIRNEAGRFPSDHYPIRAIIEFE